MSSFKALLPCCFPQRKHEDEEEMVMRDVDFLERPRSGVWAPPSSRRCPEETVTVMQHTGKIEVIHITAEDSPCHPAAALNILDEEAPHSLSETCESYKTVDTFYKSVTSECEGFDKSCDVGQAELLIIRDAMDSIYTKNDDTYRFQVDCRSLQAPVLDIFTVEEPPHSASEICESFKTADTLYESVRSVGERFDKPGTIAQRTPLTRRNLMDSDGAKDAAPFCLPEDRQCLSPASLNILDEETPHLASEVCENFKNVDTLHVSVRSEGEGFEKPSAIGQRALFTRRHSMDFNGPKYADTGRLPDQSFQTTGILFESTRNDGSGSNQPNVLGPRKPIIRRHSLHSTDLKDIATYRLIDSNRRDMIPARSSRAVRLVQSMSAVQPHGTALMVNYEYVENYIADVVTESMLDQTPNLSHDGEDGYHEMGSIRSCVVDYLDPFNGFESQRVHVSPRSEYDHWG